MKTFSIVDAAVEPFRQVGRRPVATIVWGLVMLAPTLLVMGVMLPMLGEIFSNGFDPAAMEAGSSPEEMLFGDDMATMMQFQLWSNLANLVGILSLILVTAAIIRAVFAGRKGDPAFFLRIGMGELQVAVVGLAVGIGFMFVAVAVCLLAVGIGFAIWQLGDPWRWLLCIVMGVAVFLGLMLLWGRLSLLAPASIRYRTFAFEQGWKLGRGKTWSLLGLWLVLFLIAIIVGLAFLILFLIVAAVASGGLSAMNPEAIEAWFRGLPEQPALLAGMAAILIIPMAWFHGLSQALFTAPYAYVVQALSAEDETQEVVDESH